MFESLCIQMLIELYFTRLYKLCMYDFLNILYIYVLTKGYADLNCTFFCFLLINKL